MKSKDASPEAYARTVVKIIIAPVDTQLVDLELYAFSSPNSAPQSEGQMTTRNYSADCLL